MRAGERRFVTLVHGVRLVVPGLLALSCTASVSGRAGGGGAYLTVTSGSVCIVDIALLRHQRSLART